MKRRFRITITPDTHRDTYYKLQFWTERQWGINFNEARIHFRGWSTVTLYFCTGIEVFDKTAKAL